MYLSAFSGSNFKLKARGRVAIAAIAATIMLSGCSVGSTMRAAEAEPEIITGSIVKPVESEGIDATDAELIKQTVAGAEIVNESHLLAWSNPDTGNKGTIMAIEDFAGSHGQQCKKFRTTVDSFMGISLYNGETCELKQGFWVLSWFLREKVE